MRHCPSDDKLPLEAMWERAANRVDRVGGFDSVHVSTSLFRPPVEPASVKTAFTPCIGAR